MVTHEESSGSRNRAGDGALAFSRIYRHLKKSGKLPSQLSWEQLSVLSIVARRAPLSISKLSAMENVTCATMSRNVASLRAAGLVRCSGSDTDARSVLVRTTAKGRTVVERGIALLLRDIKDVMSRLDGSVLDAMAGLIDAARDSGSSP
jgi:DNA-binding MarR family transcriptional regulator